MSRLPRPEVDRDPLICATFLVQSKSSFEFESISVMSTILVIVDVNRIQFSIYIYIYNVLNRITEKPNKPFCHVIWQEKGHCIYKLNVID